jgi:hypothetical protein
MLPKELEDILDRFSEDYIDIYVKKIEHASTDLIIDITVEVGHYTESIFQQWRITARNHRKNRISFESAPSISITADHPLLWQFTDIQCELYFAGQCKDVPKLFYDLYHVHMDVFRRYDCFDMEAAEETCKKPFEYTSGYLTQGPKTLMEMYGECLRQNGMDYSTIGERPPTYWDGRQHVPELKDLKILFIGHTYVIGSDFVFEKISSL